MEQVSILAKGEGELATEAKIFLDIRCKEGNKKAKPAYKRHRSRGGSNPAAIFSIGARSGAGGLAARKSL